MKSLDQHNADALAHPPRATGNGIACPKCGHELRDSEPGMALMSDPPKYTVDCEACGYRGTRY